MTGIDVFKKKSPGQHIRTSWWPPSWNSKWPPFWTYFQL